MKGSDEYEKSTEVKLINWRNAPEGHGHRGAMNTDRALCEARSTVSRAGMLGYFIWRLDVVRVEPLCQVVMLHKNFHAILCNLYIDFCIPILYNKYIK